MIPWKCPRKTLFQHTVGCRWSPCPFAWFRRPWFRKEQVEAEGKCGNYQTFLKRGFLKLSIMPKWACTRGTCLIALSSPVAAIWRESTTHALWTIGQKYLWNHFLLSTRRNWSKKFGYSEKVTKNWKNIILSGIDPCEKRKNILKAIRFVNSVCTSFSLWKQGPSH